MTKLNADKCFIFTDTETTGLDINFSQIVQVGSLMTNEDLQVEEEHNLFSKLLPWIVPSPEAFLVHRKTESLDEQSPSHYEMMKSLREDWMKWSSERNPVYITYNGHRFDEELFRRQFYWCLLPPYITNTGGATRLDLMFTFQIVANFFPEALKVPKNEDDEVSLKLTDWADANNISSLNAHDALADCYLMVNLARLIANNAGDAWSGSLIGSSKDGNLRLLQSEPFAMIGEVIRKQKFTFPVTFCGQNQKMQNEVAVADLYFDPDTLNELSDTELLEQISGGGTAIRKVRINKSLPVINSENVPNIQNHLDIPYEQLEERARKIRNNTNLQLRVSELMANNQFQYPPPKHIEQAVYQGFPTNEDELWMERFHSTPWEERSKLIEGFEDSRYRELAERLIFANSPKQLNETSLKKYTSFLRQRLNDEGPWLNLEKTLEKITNLLEKEEDDEKKEILVELDKKLRKMRL